MSEQQKGLSDQAINPLGGSLKQFKDKKSKERPVPGALEAFGSLIFKANTPDQAEMYIRTTEKLSEYVLTTFGRDMRNLVKYATEREFTEPPFPSKKLRESDKLHEVKYKESLAKYHRELDTYQDQKTKMFGIILGQCSPMVKDRLAKNQGFKKVEMDSDVMEVLKMLQEMAYSTLGHQEPNWSLVTVLRRLLTMQQRQGDTIQTYYLRFKSQAAVLQAQWGKFYPPNLAKNEDQIDFASEAILTAIFLANSDNVRFRTLKERLNNEYLSGKNNYPTTLEQAVNLLTYNQDFGTQIGRSDPKSLNPDISLGQTRKKAGKGNKKKTTTDDAEDSDGTPPSSPRRTSSRSPGWSS